MRWNLRWGVTGLIVGLVGWLGVMAVWPERDPWPPRSVIALPADCRVLGFSADGRSFQVETGKSISAWDLATGRRTERVPAAWIDQKRFSQDRRMFVGVIVDHFKQKGIAVGDTATEAIRTRFPLGSRWAYRVDLVDDDRKVRAVVGQRNAPIEVVTWDLATGAETTRTIQGPGPGPAWQAVISPNGPTWAYLNQVRHAIQFWDITADRPIGGELQSPTPAPTPATWEWAKTMFTPDGRTLIAGRSDGLAEFWDVAGLRRIKTVRLHPRDHTIYSLMISPDGRTLASTGVGLPSDSRLGRVWESIRFRATGHSSFGEVQEAALTDLATDQLLARWGGSTFRGFAPDGRTIVTCERGKTLSIRDMKLPVPEVRP